MLNNHAYDLLSQLTEEHKSLWRMREMYESDSDRCPQCQEFWQRMEEQKLRNVSELEELLKSHLQDEDNYRDEPDSSGKKVSFATGSASSHTLSSGESGKLAHPTETGRKSRWQAPVPI
ncbi:hypothetical protein HYV43_06975 [Candidatus Micrarchaeota archaeon]|nr:hypothetical protein [Candidatus Micrarchaeota archaeon]